MHKRLIRWTTATALVALLAACGTDSGNDVANEPATTERLLETPNAGWINVEGIVTSVGQGAFVMDYGDSTITVEMDDWDWFRESSHIKVGDNVAVTGRIDRDLLERATLEASSVFVENIGTYFYASGRDEEDLAASTIYMVAPAGAVDATGHVTAIEGREFTIGTDFGSMRVDTTRMSDNPMDGAGDPRVRIADRVYVWGGLDVDARERNELMAEGLVVLRPTPDEDDQAVGQETGNGQGKAEASPAAPD